MHEQCEDRTYRIGQQKEVLATYLVASAGPGRPTLDEAVMGLGERKRGDAAALLGGKGAREQQRMDSLLSVLHGGAAGGPSSGGARRKGQVADPSPHRPAPPAPTTPTAPTPESEMAEPLPKRARGPSPQEVIDLT